MNDVQIFDNDDFGPLRMVVIDGAPWVYGKDAATALQYANPQKAVRDHVDPEDRIEGHALPREERNVPHGERNGTFTPVNDSFTPSTTPILINESGLYSLILTSKMPKAKQFKHWITSEVLPSIRKTGAYAVSCNTEPALPAPTEAQEPEGAVTRGLTIDDYMRAAQLVATCKNERLPYVFHYLTAAGLDVPALRDTPAAQAEARARGIEAVRLANRAHNDYNWSYGQLGQLFGLARVQMQRYCSGSSIPREPRASLMVETLKREIPELAEEGECESV